MKEYFWMKIQKKKKKIKEIFFIFKYSKKSTASYLQIVALKSAILYECSSRKVFERKKKYFSRSLIPHLLIRLEVVPKSKKKPNFLENSDVM